MGNRTAPGGGTRLFVSSLVFALVTSVVQVASTTPALAVSGEFGPAPIPQTDTSALIGANGQWDTKNQHRIWWNAGAGRWDAILPAEHRCCRRSRGRCLRLVDRQGRHPRKPWRPTGLRHCGGRVNIDPAQRPDAYWDETAQRLYLLFSGGATPCSIPTTTTAPTTRPAQRADHRHRDGLLRLPGRHLQDPQREYLGRCHARRRVADQQVHQRRRRAGRRPRPVS